MSEGHGELREWVVKTTFHDGEVSYSCVRRNKEEADEWLRFQQRAWHMFTHEIVHFSEVPKETEDPIGDGEISDGWNLEPDPRKVEHIKGVLNQVLHRNSGYSTYIFDDADAAAPHSNWFDATEPTICPKCGRHYVMGLYGIRL